MLTRVGCERCTACIRLHRPINMPRMVGGDKHTACDWFKRRKGYRRHFIGQTCILSQPIISTAVLWPPDFRRVHFSTRLSEGPLFHSGIPHSDPQKDAMNVGGGVLRQVRVGCIVKPVLLFNSGWLVFLWFFHGRGQL
jgi:hypothetical protein